MSKRRFVTVLYEDSVDPQSPRLFGPHILLLACLADATGEDRWSTLRDKVQHVPKNSNGNLKTALAQDAAGLVNAGPVVAVYDDDQVRNLYGLEATACRSEVLGAIAKEACATVSVVLLDRNVETLVSCAARHLGDPPPTGKPKPKERDRILCKVADADRSVRSSVLKDVATFKRLVSVVQSMLTTLGS